jgi:hypothetical protein
VTDETIPFYYRTRTSSLCILSKYFAFCCLLTCTEQPFWFISPQSSNHCWYFTEVSLRINALSVDLTTLIVLFEYPKVIRSGACHLQRDLIQAVFTKEPHQLGLLHAMCWCTVTVQQQILFTIALSKTRVALLLCRDRGPFGGWMRCGRSWISLFNPQPGFILRYPSLMM